MNLYKLILSTLLISSVSLSSGAQMVTGSRFVVDSMTPKRMITYITERGRDDLSFREAVRKFYNQSSFQSSMDGVLHKIEKEY